MYKFAMEQIDRPAGHGGASLAEAFNPFSGAQLADPYPIYAQLRAEAPVFYSPLLRMWYVTRYDDIVAVLKDPARFSSVAAINTPLDYTEQTRRAAQSLFITERTLVDNDPPAHTSIRRLVSKAFTVRLSAMEARLRIIDAAAPTASPRVRAIAERLIDGFVADGRAEFLTQFSDPMPMRVILAMLGAPEDDMPLFKRWAEDWVTHISIQQTAEQQAATIARLADSQRYWTELIAARQAEPRDDLLSDLLAASRSEAVPLSNLQLVNLCATIVLAGHETTSNLLGHCLHRLLRDREQWRLVLDDPANIPRAFEETLRADTSVQALMRTTREPVELAGVKIPEGAQVALLFASGSHDAAYFVDPARFDLRREPPRAHLAFGHGVHFCLGAALARIEGRVAIELLARRLPGLRLAEQEITYVPNPMVRALTALHIVWDVPSFP